MSASKRPRLSTDKSSSSSSTSSSLVNSPTTNNPQREFIIILTNSQDLIQRLANNYSNDQLLQRSVTIGTDTATYNTEREQLLAALLQVELQNATRDYLSRTRRSYPIQYVFNVSDVDLAHPQS